MPPQWKSGHLVLVSVCLYVNWKRNCKWTYAITIRDIDLASAIYTQLIDTKVEFLVILTVAVYENVRDSFFFLVHVLKTEINWLAIIIQVTFSNIIMTNFVFLYNIYIMFSLDRSRKAKYGKMRHFTHYFCALYKNLIRNLLKSESDRTRVPKARITISHFCSIAEMHHHFPHGICHDLIWLNDSRRFYEYDIHQTESSNVFE